MIAGETNIQFSRRVLHAARVSWDQAKHTLGTEREQNLRSAVNLGNLAKEIESTPD